MPREIFYAEHAQIHHAAMQVEIFYATMPWVLAFRGLVVRLHIRVIDTTLAAWRPWPGFYISNTSK